ncbi:MAG: hypothetical protein CM1200mP30_07110 [Pseudomonadota bacterium]|nr:MAG: hypothetical protein CM1200mP30_07110 [Pseudomonadota bacterium]
MSNRANGRTGMGAVMGSKNPKAVVVRGKMKPLLLIRKNLRNFRNWPRFKLEPTGWTVLANMGLQVYVLHNIEPEDCQLIISTAETLINMKKLMATNFTMSI